MDFHLRIFHLPTKYLKGYFEMNLLDSDFLLCVLGVENENDVTSLKTRK